MSTDLQPLIDRIYKEAVERGQLKVDESIEKGFKVSFRNDQVYQDVTAEAIAEALNELLRPHLGNIVKRVAIEDPSLKAYCSVLLSTRNQK